MVTLDFPFGASVQSVAVAANVEYPARPRLELRVEGKGNRGLNRVCWYHSRALRWIDVVGKSLFRRGLSPSAALFWLGTRGPRRADPCSLLQTLGSPVSV